MKNPDKKTVDKGKRLLAKCEHFLYVCDMPKAEEYGLKALEFAEKNLPKDSAVIVNTHYALGKVYIILGKHDVAEKHVKTSLNLLDKTKKFDRLHALEVLYNAYAGQQKYLEGQKVAQDILEFNKAEGGYEIPIAVSLDRLAKCLLGLKKFKEAKELTEQSLEVHKRLSVDHPSLYSAALITYAKILAQEGDVSGAEKSCKKVLDLYAGKGVNLSNTFGVPCTIFNKGEMKKELAKDLITYGFLKEIYGLYKKIGKDKEAEKLTSLSNKIISTLTEQQRACHAGNIPSFEKS